MTDHKNTFVDIHVLQTVPPSCINRDDTGSPKSAVYGGVERARVSSQAWKRAARRDFSEHLAVDQLGERTLKVVDRISRRVQELGEQIDPEQALKAAQEALSKTGIKVKVEKKKAKDEEAAEVETQNTGYLVFLSRAQINALAALALDSIDGATISKAAAQRAFKDDSSIDVALFGRMIADAPELNVDAACQVAHAISVHEVVKEFDYFTAVDDNSPEDNAGAGMIGTVEFASSTLYRYATIDVVRLTENLGSEEAALAAVEAFVRSFVTSMPTGKQNTFANRTRPGFVLTEVRHDQPVSLVGAFEDPVRADRGILPQAASSLVEYAVAGDKKYGTHPAASFVMVADPNAAAAAERLEERAQDVDFDALVARTAEAARAGTAAD